MYWILYFSTGQQNFFTEFEILFFVSIWYFMNPSSKGNIFNNPSSRKWKKKCQVSGISTAFIIPEKRPKEKVVGIYFLHLQQDPNLPYQILSLHSLLTAALIWNIARIAKAVQSIVTEGSFPKKKMKTCKICKILDCKGCTVHCQFDLNINDHAQKRKQIALLYFSVLWMLKYMQMTV